MVQKIRNMITSPHFHSPGLRDRISNTLRKNRDLVYHPACTSAAAWGVILLASLMVAMPAMAARPVANRPVAIAEARPAVRSAPDAVSEGRIDVSHARPIHSASRVNQPVVEQVGYFDQSIGCDSGVFDPVCGCESVCDCPVGQAYRQVYADPHCGTEASCGLEPWVEPGCGAEGCTIAGCDGCCDGMNPNCGCNVCRGGVRGFLDGLFPRLSIPWQRMDLYAGVTGHTGPMNFANVSATGNERVGAGSFGFYEGYNKGLSLKFFGTDLAYQSGARFLQSNLSGAGFTEDTRVQIFLTSGLFRRVDRGLQYGVVVDYLYDDWYYRGDLMQLRGELSWVMRNSHVLGLKFAAGVDDDTALTSVIDASGTVVRNQIAFEATTQYRLFYRQQLARCGLLEGFAGWTDNDDGLLGMELDLPIHGNLLWNTSATYLIPNEGTGNGGQIQEGWNLMIGFTYRPGGLRSGSRYDRPLMKVADNGTMLVDRK